MSCYFTLPEDRIKRVTAYLKYALATCKATRVYFIGSTEKQQGLVFPGVSAIVVGESARVHVSVVSLAEWKKPEEFFMAVDGPSLVSVLARMSEAVFSSTGVTMEIFQPNRKIRTSLKTHDIESVTAESLMIEEKEALDTSTFLLTGSRCAVTNPFNRAEVPPTMIYQKASGNYAYLMTMTSYCVALAQIQRIPGVDDLEMIIPSTYFDVFLKAVSISLSDKAKTRKSKKGSEDISPEYTSPVRLSVGDYITLTVSDAAVSLAALDNVMTQPAEKILSLVKTQVVESAEFPPPEFTSALGSVASFDRKADIIFTPGSIHLHTKGMAGEAWSMLAGDVDIQYAGSLSTALLSDIITLIGKPEKMRIRLHESINGSPDYNLVISASGVHYVSTTKKAKDSEWDELLRGLAQ